jgi:O-antigen biosynthesis protein
MRQRILFRLKRTKNLIQRGLRSLRVRGLRASLAMISPNLKRQTANSGLAQLTAQDIAAVEQHDFHCPAPKLSIIIPVHNHIELSQACLAALIKHNGALAYELIIVNDASHDDTANYFSKLTGLHYIEHGSPQGFIDSCNDGAKIARGEYLLFLNNDTQVQIGSLEKLIATFTAYPDTGIVGAKLLYPNGLLQEAGAAIFQDASAWNIGRFEDANASAFNFVRECDYVSGAALAIPRKLFHELDGFDSLFSPGYYEDADLCFRARQAGFKVRYQPHACVMHLEGGTSGTSIDAGMKAFQAINQEKFRLRWQAVLQSLPIRSDDADSKAALIHAYQKKSLLFIDEKTPKPDHDSGALRLFSLMKLSIKENYRTGFTSLNFQASYPETATLEAAGIECFHQQGTNQKHVLAWLEKNASAFDVILLSRMTVMDMLHDRIRAFAPKTKIIFDTVDLHFLREQSEAQVKGSDLLKKQAAFSREKELVLTTQADETWVVSHSEFDLLTNIYPNQIIRMVSNIHALHTSTAPFQQRKNLLFVANFRHPPNLDGLSWFIENCWPLIRSRHSTLELHIIGAGLGETEQKKLQKAGIVFCGHVPEIEPSLNAARINIAPLRYGAGAKGKISQALACGLPSIGTDIAMDGMFLEDKISMMVANNAQMFADAVLALYDDELLWQRLSRNGLNVAEQHFSEQAAGSMLREAIESLSTPA